MWSKINYKGFCTFSRSKKHTPIVSCERLVFPVAFNGTYLPCDDHPQTQQTHTQFFCKKKTYCFTKRVIFIYEMYSWCPLPFEKETVGPDTKMRCLEMEIPNHLLNLVWNWANPVHSVPVIPEAFKKWFTVVFFPSRWFQLVQSGSQYFYIHNGH